MTKDSSTEERIKQAAQKVFHNKGFSGTRTRDIAEEAGVNLALLNYYFRSKQSLFEIIMFETIARFFGSLTTVVDDPQTSLEEKIAGVVSNYMDLLSQEPDLPLFMLTEIRNNPDRFISKTPIKNVLLKSIFLQQFKDAVHSGKLAPVHPLHFIMNVLSMTVFPFITRPVIGYLGQLSQTDFESMMQERKKMIPLWVMNAMQNTNTPEMPNS